MKLDFLRINPFLFFFVSGFSTYAINFPVYANRFPNYAVQFPNYTHGFPTYINNFPTYEIRYHVELPFDEINFPTN